MRNLKLWNEWYGKDDAYDIVINGSSRGMVQYDPRILDSALNTKSFNLSINGSHINRHIFKYKIFRKTHPKPKLIIQNFESYTMSITMGYDTWQFYPYWNDRYFVGLADEWEHFSPQDKYLPMIRWFNDTENMKKLMFRHGVIEETVIKGYVPQDKGYDGALLAEKMETGMTYNRDTTAIRIFCEYVEQVRAEGTEIVFVHAPIYKDVYEKVVDDPEGMFFQYDSIAQLYNITILDYTHMPICSDTTYFYNATHMNRKGAEIFTRQLAHDIDSLGLLKK